MKQLLFSATFALAVSIAAAEKPYDFRASQAYQQLSGDDVQRLEQVRHDQILLWGALDIYADEHMEELPATLDALVPRYLPELPADPFASQPAREEPKPGNYTPSKGGWGYRYKRGSPGNRAWIISSVGLPEFPYRGERSSGLYLAKGTWLSGRNPAMIKKK